MLRTIVFALVATIASAFVVPAVSMGSNQVSSSCTPTRAAITQMAEGASVSPLQAAVIGGGTLGILGAAFCTSTGSPPTGLAVALAAVAFMAAGAGAIEGGE